MTTPSLQSTLERLYALTPKGAQLGLDRARAASEALGSPHKIPHYVHVAGTNGKGSTSAWVAEMAKAAGMKVGLYTSPHLCRFAERIRINGEPIADDTLASVLDRVMNVSSELTVFEVATIAAMLAFKEANVDLAVLEVGLGGRLDATNIVEGDGVQAITRIAFDHTALLGGSLWAIAREKSGVMRRNQRCVIGKLHPDAHASVLHAAEEAGAVVVEAGSPRDESILDQFPPALLGGFQRSNATVAVAVARELNLPISAIGSGLTSVSWPGRCELIRHSTGPILLDGAHNPDGALALRNVLYSLSSAFLRKRVALVFGAMADKRWKAMLERLAPVVGPRVYVEPSSGSRQAVSTVALDAFSKGERASSVKEALATARSLVGPSGLVVVCGSLYLVGEARAILFGLDRDPPLAF
ncbi:MAG: folylpolyglutamate synthase/dihydrofolate synthase family protein [Polyangiaceae bacterium]